MGRGGAISGFCAVEYRKCSCLPLKQNFRCPWISFLSTLALAPGGLEAAAAARRPTHGTGRRTRPVAAPAGRGGKGTTRGLLNRRNLIWLGCGAPSSGSIDSATWGWGRECGGPERLMRARCLLECLYTEGCPAETETVVEAMFQASIYVEVGNGQKALFWTDRWLQGHSKQCSWSSD